MTVDQFKARLREKRNDIADPASDQEKVDNALCDVFGVASRFLDRGVRPAGAVDPSFWLTIVQLVLPIILEWINRRFPAPPKPAPTPLHSPVTQGMD